MTPSARLPHTPRLIALSVGALLGLGSFAGAAQDPGGQTRTPRNEEQRALADSVRRVERATRGEVLSAERVPFDGRDVNRVKVVDASGRVRVYMDDPHGRRDRNDPSRTRGNDANSD